VKRAYGSFRAATREVGARPRAARYSGDGRVSGLSIGQESEVPGAIDAEPSQGRHRGTVPSQATDPTGRAQNRHECAERTNALLVMALAADHVAHRTNGATPDPRRRFA